MALQHSFQTYFSDCTPSDARDLAVGVFRLPFFTDDCDRNARVVIKKFRRLKTRNNRQIAVTLLIGDPGVRPTPFFLKITVFMRSIRREMFTRFARIPVESGRRDEQPHIEEATIVSWR